MQRIEVNLETGEVKTVDLTPEEVATAQAQYEAWLAEEEAKKANLQQDLENQIAGLQAQLNELKGA